MAAYSAATPGFAPMPSPGDTPSSQAYLFSRSNLTSSQTDIAMQQYSGEVGRLRTALYIEMPWNSGIGARSLILLQNTDTSLDGLYHVDSLERRFNSVTGSSQAVRAVSWPVAN